MATSSSSPANISLPAGWTISSWRETSQSINGQVLQGIVFTLQAPMGGASSVFVPYSVLSNPDAVKAMFLQRIAAITAITS